MVIQLAPDFREALAEFLDSPRRNQWLSTSQLNIYVRKSKRFVWNQFIPILDIGDIEVAEELRGQGLFSQVLDLMKSNCGDEYRGVLVENVLNPRLRKHLRRMASDDPEHCVWEDRLTRFFWLTISKES